MLWIVRVCHYLHHNYFYTRSAPSSSHCLHLTNNSNFNTIHDYQSIHSSMYLNYISLPTICFKIKIIKTTKKTIFTLHNFGSFYCYFGMRTYGPLVFGPVLGTDKDFFNFNMY